MTWRRPVDVGPPLKKNWTATHEAFERFLRWLDNGVESGGERYVEMRRRLVGYFTRKHCSTADDLADETLNRVARRLDEEGRITDAPPAHYCFIVARYVFLEHLRSDERRQAEGASLDAALLPARPPADEDDDRLEALERCLAHLPAADRDLILLYYGGDGRARIESRRRLAARLGTTTNGLSIRACRIRAKLEACVSGGRDA